MREDEHRPPCILWRRHRHSRCLVVFCAPLDITASAGVFAFLSPDAHLEHPPWGIRSETHNTRMCCPLQLPGTMFGTHTACTAGWVRLWVSASAPHGARERCVALQCSSAVAHNRPDHDRSHHHNVVGVSGGFRCAVVLNSGPPG